jgi:hypothetical protein
MVTTLTTGLCDGENGALAAKGAVSQAKEKLGRARIDLSIVYSSSEYDYQEVVDVVREVTGNAPLIGASTAESLLRRALIRGMWLWAYYPQMISRSSLLFPRA